MDFQEIGCGYVDWIELAENRDNCRALVNKVMDIRLFRNFLTRLETGSF